MSDLTERRASPAEIEHLRALRSALALPAAASAIPLLAIWLVTVALTVAVWRGLAFVAERLWQTSLGWGTAAHNPTLGVIAVLALLRSIRTLRERGSARRNGLRAIDRDLESGIVQEEPYHFNAARRYREPEHGGLIYLLRTIDARVLVLYDAESVDSDGGAPGERELLQPRTHLTLVRAAQSGIVLAQHFDGELLAVDETHEIRASPERWPDDETVWDVDWDEAHLQLTRP